MGFITLEQVSLARNILGEGLLFREATLKQLRTGIDGNTHKKADPVLVRMVSVSEEGLIEFFASSVTVWPGKRDAYRVRVLLEDWNEALSEPDLNWSERANLAVFGDVRVHCECGAFLYFGYKYILDQLDALYKDAADWEGNRGGEKRFPEVRNPDLVGVVCKHLDAVLYVLTMSISNVAKAMKEMAAHGKITVAKPDAEEETEGAKSAQESASRDSRFKRLARLQRGKPERAMLDIQRSQICQVYGWLAEHVGDLTHRMSEHAEENHAGYHSVKDKVRKTLRELRLPRGFEFYVMQQIRNNVRAMHEDGEWLGETVESKLEELKALGREYARAHSELPVQNEAQLMARYAAESVGEFKFSAAETFLRRLEKVIDKGREAWEQFALEDDPDWTPRSSGFSTDDFRRCAGWT
jgi:hypothetical protein